MRKNGENTNYNKRTGGNYFKYFLAVNNLFYFIRVSLNYEFN